MSWLKPDAPPNIQLYADMQQRHTGRAYTPSGRGVRQWREVGTVSGSSGDGDIHGGAIRVVGWGHA